MNFGFKVLGFVTVVVVVGWALRLNQLQMNLGVDVDVVAMIAVFAVQIV